MLNRFVDTRRSQRLQRFVDATKLCGNPARSFGPHSNELNSDVVASWAHCVGGHGATEMPLLAYIWKVGAALLALLFAANLCLPQDPVAEKTATDRPAIRIHSDRKLPERVVLDTSMPVIVAAAPEVSTAQAPGLPHRAEPPIIRAETPAVANSLAMARTDPSSRGVVERKPPRKSQHVAMRSKRHAPPQMVLAARQGQFAWFGYRYW